MADATVLAIAGSSGNPWVIVRCNVRKTSSLSRLSITSPVNVSQPNVPDTGAVTSSRSIFLGRENMSERVSSGAMVIGSPRIVRDNNDGRR